MNSGRWSGSTSGGWRRSRSLSSERWSGPLVTGRWSSWLEFLNSRGIR